MSGSPRGSLALQVISTFAPVYVISNESAIESEIEECKTSLAPSREVLEMRFLSQTTNGDDD